MAALKRLCLGEGTEPDDVLLRRAAVGTGQREPGSPKSHSHDHVTHGTIIPRCDSNPAQQNASPMSPTSCATSPSSSTPVNNVSSNNNFLGQKREKDDPG